MSPGAVPPATLQPAPGWAAELKTRLEQQYGALELDAHPIERGAYHFQLRGPIALTERTKDDGRIPIERVRASAESFLTENRDLLLRSLPDSIAYREEGISPPGAFSKDKPYVASYSLYVAGFPVVPSQVKVVVSSEGVITAITGSIPRINSDILTEIQQAVEESRRLSKEDVLARIQDHRAKAGLPTDLTPPGVPIELQSRYMPRIAKLVYLEPPHVRLSIQGFWYKSGMWRYHVDGLTGVILHEIGPAHDH